MARLNSLINSYAAQNGNKIDTIQSFNGGYERWFQIDFAYYILLQSRLFPLLEANEYGDHNRLDILVLNQNGPDLAVELKCQSELQRTTGFDNFINGILDDCAKITRLPEGLDRQVVVSCYRDQLENIKSILSGVGFTFKVIIMNKESAIIKYELQ